MLIDLNFLTKKCESLIGVKKKSAFKLCLGSTTPPKHIWTREWLSHSAHKCLL